MAYRQGSSASNVRPELKLDEIMSREWAVLGEVVRKAAELAVADHMFHEAMLQAAAAAEERSRSKDVHQIKDVHAESDSGSRWA